MATAPQPEAPPTPEQAPPEVSPPPPDVDIPSPTPTPSGDQRSDIQQVVEARRDAVERGEGGPEPETFTSAGLPSGGGTGGVTRNQEEDAQ
ncbi:hypothetical protein U1839_23980 [Sphingomonas sp. RT2P30]|uniref:hypothetical protein n=1 Tax=Parasphingomonas halimpatiens TaxID=3096162 RepID=UPI002FCB3A06